MITFSHPLWNYDRYHYKIITPPAFEHISLDEARDHLRIIPFGSPAMSEEDSWLTNNITVAREWCEWWSGTAFCIQTLELGIASFPMPFSNFLFDPTGVVMGSASRSIDNSIMLPMGFPLISVDSVSYDISGGVNTLSTSDYYVNDYERPARVYPSPGTSWPSAQIGKTNAVRIRYTCGFSILGDSPVGTPIPLALKAAMLLVLGHLHENRENSSEIAVTEIPLGAASLMERYRCRLSMA